MLGEDGVQALLELQHELDADLHVAGLALGPAEHLVDHDVGIGQGEALALGATGQEDGSHARGLADAVGVHVAGQPLHGVIDGQTGRDRSAGRVDVNMDVLLRVFHLEEEHLGNDEIGDVVVDRRADENDAVLEQARINVVATLPAAGLFDHHGNEDGIARCGGAGSDRMTHKKGAAAPGVRPWPRLFSP